MTRTVRSIAGIAILVFAGCSLAPPPNPSVSPGSSPSASPGAARQTPSPSPVSTSTSSGGCADRLAASHGRIAFTVQVGEAGGVATVNADGSGFRMIVEPGPGREQPHAGVSAPQWIAFGNMLFSSNRAGGPDDWHLFVVDVPGEPEQLTDDPDRIEYHGVLSADGPMLAHGTALATGDPEEPYRDVGIFLRDMAVDGAKRQLAVPPEGMLDEWPDISPDVTRVAFTRAMGGEPGSARGSIYVANVDGSGLQQITDPKMNAIHPRWSPDGKLIAFSTNADNHMVESANVWVVAPDGTGLRQLTFASGMSQAFFPDWSPDGQHLVYLQHRAGSGTQDLAVIGLDGSGPCTLWAGTGQQLAGDPDWAPPGD